IMKTPDSAFRNNANMLSIRQIEKASDSIKKIIQNTLPSRAKKESFSYLQFQKLFDSTKWYPSKQKIPDSVRSYMNLLPDSIFVYTYSRLNEKAGMVKNSLEIIASEQKHQKEEFINHQVEWHRKFSLSFACLVLFMIGAPLGSIIRKGGLGMPLVIAVIFFLIFHLLNMFGEKFTKNMTFPPYIGMWLSTIVLTPIGLFLTYKAMRDSQLFNQEFYFRLFRKIKVRLSKNKEPK
ncbi:MAG: LptF/LptG family permease, partial [Chitinophagaceae bacterium]